MEPGMNAQLYTLATADWRLDEISAEHTGFFPRAGCVLLFVLLQPVQLKPTDKSSIPQPTAA